MPQALAGTVLSQTRPPPCAILKANPPAAGRGGPRRSSRPLPPHPHGSCSPRTEDTLFPGTTAAPGLPSATPSPSRGQQRLCSHDLHPHPSGPGLSVLYMQTPPKPPGPKGLGVPLASSFPSEIQGELVSRLPGPQHTQKPWDKGRKGLMSFNSPDMALTWPSTLLRDTQETEPGTPPLTLLQLS